MEPNELEKTWPRVYSILGINGIARLSGCNIELGKKYRADGAVFFELEFSRYPYDRDWSINRMQERALLDKLEKFNGRGLRDITQYHYKHPSYPNTSRYFNFHLECKPRHVYVKMWPRDNERYGVWYSRDTKNGTDHVFDILEEYFRARHWREVEFARLLPQPIAEEILEHI